VADKHPPGDHHPPWSVCDNVHGGNGVVDGAGVLVIGVDDPWQNIEFMDDYAREIVLAAPEMEALLREIVASDPYDCLDAVDRQKEVAAMIARLDEARRG